MSEINDCHTHQPFPISVHLDGIVPVEAKTTYNPDGADENTFTSGGKYIEIKFDQQFLDQRVLAIEKHIPPQGAFGRRTKNLVSLTTWESPDDCANNPLHYHLNLSLSHSPDNLKTVSDFLGNTYRAIGEFIDPDYINNFISGIMLEYRLSLTSDFISLEKSNTPGIYIDPSYSVLIKDMLDPVAAGSALEDTNGRWNNGHDYRSKLSGENQFIEYLTEESPNIGLKKLGIFAGMRFETLDFLTVQTMISDILKDDRLLFKPRMQKIRKIFDPYLRFEIL